MSFVQRIHLLPFGVGQSSADGRTRAEAAKFWQGYFAGQNNPLFQVSNPREYLNRCLSVAYWQRFSETSERILGNEGTGVARAIWSGAARRAMAARAKGGEGFEACILAEALAFTEIAGAPGVKPFGVYDAYALAFCMGMGTGRMRLPDITEPSMKVRRGLCAGTVNLGDAFVRGCSAVATQLVTDWNKALKDEGRDAVSALDELEGAGGRIVEQVRQGPRGVVGQARTASLRRSTSFAGKRRRLAAR